VLVPGQLQQHDSISFALHHRPGKLTARLLPFAPGKRASRSGGKGDGCFWCIGSRLVLRQQLHRTVTTNSCPAARSHSSFPRGTRSSRRMEVSTAIACPAPSGMRCCPGWPTHPFARGLG
jgi:hypothetical protein